MLNVPLASSRSLERAARVGAWVLALSLAFAWLSPAHAGGVEILHDFEAGLPAGWFAYFGGAASLAMDFPTVSDAEPLARPGQVGDNTMAEATFDATVGFAGYGSDFTSTIGAQDWTARAGVSFWHYGENNGDTFVFLIYDNGSDSSVDTAERFEVSFVDDLSGWHKHRYYFADFSRSFSFQPAGAPNDGLTLTEVWGFAIALDGAAGTLTVDDFAVESAAIYADGFESGDTSAWQ